MELSQAKRQKKLVEETNQIPAENRAEKYNKITGCYL